MIRAISIVVVHIIRIDKTPVRFRHGPHMKSFLKILFISLVFSTLIYFSLPFKTLAFETSIPADSVGWSLDTSGTMESVVKTTEGWQCTAGGNTASTHYARIKYKLPEQAQRVLTKFYMKAVVVLPSNFYSQQEAGFRLMNTDNYGTTLNGSPVGTTSIDELRAAVYFNRDGSVAINAKYENHQSKELWRSLPMQFATGQHTFELYGDLASVSPWYFKADGVVLASGIDRFSTDDVPVNERVATRMVAGIDGAASQDTKPLNVLIKSFEIADYDKSVGAPALIGDVNDDGFVNIIDIGIVVDNYDLSSTADARADLDNNGIINIIDIGIVIDNYTN